jgi:hypothetical protein
MEEQAMMKKVSRKAGAQNFGINGADGVQGIQMQFKEFSL